jgi:homoserine kinase
MAITYCGERRLDAESSSIIYNVLVGNDTLYCTIDTRVLESICSEGSGAIEQFNSCRMFILACTYGKYNHADTILSDHIKIVRQAELIPTYDRAAIPPSTARSL